MPIPPTREEIPIGAQIVVLDYEPPRTVVVTRLGGTGMTEAEGRRSAHVVLQGRRAERGADHLGAGSHELPDGGGRATASGSSSGEACS